MEMQKLKIKQLISQRSFEDALDLAKSVYANDKIKFLITRSFILLKQGNKSKAIEDALKAYSLMPGAETAYNLAYIYNSMNDSIQVKRWLAKALESDPRFERTYFLLHNYYNKRFKHKEALLYLKRGLKHNPSSEALNALIFDAKNSIMLKRIVIPIVFLWLFFMFIKFYMAVFLIISGLLFSFILTIYSKLKLNAIVKAINRKD